MSIKSHIESLDKTPNQVLKFLIYDLTKSKEGVTRKYKELSESHDVLTEKYNKLKSVALLYNLVDQCDYCPNLVYDKDDDECGYKCHDCKKVACYSCGIDKFEANYINGNIYCNECE